MAAGFSIELFPRLQDVLKSIDPFELIRQHEGDFQSLVARIASMFAEHPNLPVGETGRFQSGWTENYGFTVGTDTFEGFVANPAAHAPFVVNKTGPHTRNPWFFLIPWVEYKLGLEGKEAKSAAFAIGRKKMEEQSPINPKFQDGLTFMEEVEDDAEIVIEDFMEVILS